MSATPLFHQHHIYIHINNSDICTYFHSNLAASRHLSLTTNSLQSTFFMYAQYFYIHFFIQTKRLHNNLY